MKVLVVDDDQLSRDSVVQFLKEQMEYDVYDTADGESAMRLFLKFPVPVVITDMKMPGMSGIKLLELIKTKAPETEVIIMTGFGDMESSIEALRAGATDYLLKPVNIEELAITLKRIENIQQLKKENYSLKNTIRDKDEKAADDKAKLNALQTTLQQFTQDGSIGIFSSAMKNIVSICEKLHYERDVPVLIQGETGTGKEIVAQLIHKGTRKQNESPFISVNCAAIAPQLFESELFGYAEGAFTGARKNGAAGKLELAQSGTIFLDEIGEMPLEFQTKLLRVLQERECYRVGGNKLIKLDVRIVCATNRNLNEMVNEGTFRKDLFYRLNLAQIIIPPLKDRKEEIVPLAQLFLERYAQKRQKHFRFISKEARSILEDYSWPGNVRELQNTIERVVLLYNEEELKDYHIHYLQSGNKEAILQSVGPTLENGNVILPESQLLLEELEKEIVSKALKKFGNNKTKLAEYLGISRSALRSRLRKIE